MFFGGMCNEIKQDSPRHSVDQFNRMFLFSNLGGFRDVPDWRSDFLKYKIEIQFGKTYCLTYRRNYLKTYSMQTDRRNWSRDH